MIQFTHNGKINVINLFGQLRQPDSGDAKYPKSENYSMSDIRVYFLNDPICTPYPMCFQLCA